MRGAMCNCGGGLRGGAEGHKYSVQARVRMPCLPPPAPFHTHFCHQNTTVDKFGRFAELQPPPRHANVALSNHHWMPCAPMTCFHVNLAGAKTGQPPAPIGPIGSDKASVQNTCLRPHGRPCAPSRSL